MKYTFSTQKGKGRHAVAYLAIMTYQKILICYPFIGPAVLILIKRNKNDNIISFFDLTSIITNSNVLFGINLVMLDYEILIDDYLLFDTDLMRDFKYI